MPFYHTFIILLSFVFLFPQHCFSQRKVMITANYEPSYTSLLLREGNPIEAVNGSFGYKVGLGLKYPLKKEQILLSFMLFYSFEKYLHNFSGLKFQTDILAGTESKLEIPMTVNRIGIPSIGVETYHKKLILNSNIALIRTVRAEENNLLTYGNGETERLKEVIYSYSRYNLFLDLGIGFRAKLNKNLDLSILLKAGYNFFPEELYLYHSKANHYRIGGSIGFSFNKFDKNEN